jgi:hypothetical protein
MNVTDKIDKFLIGEKECDKEEDGKKRKGWDEKETMNEMMLEPNESGIKPNEYNSLSTGLKRIEFRLLKANTPQKYVDAFEVIQQLINRFPLKSKIIWQSVASLYTARFGTATPTIVSDEGSAGTEEV